MMNRPLSKELRAPASARVNLAKLLIPRLRKNAPAVAAAPARPSHDDGSPVSDAVVERLHHENVVLPAIRQALAQPGAVIGGRP